MAKYILLTNPDVSWGNGRGCPLVAHYWVDLQSMHGFHSYDNIVTNAKCQRVLALAICLVMQLIMVHYIFNVVIVN